MDTEFIDRQRSVLKGTLEDGLLAGGWTCIRNEVEFKEWEVSNRRRSYFTPTHYPFFARHESDGMGSTIVEALYRNDLLAMLRVLEDV